MSQLRPMSIKPRAEMPSDMRENNHFENIKKEL